MVIAQLIEFHIFELIFKINPMRAFFFLTIFTFGLASFAFAGAIFQGYSLTYSPASPVAGQQVTFTNHADGEPCQEFALNPDVDNAMLQPIDDNGGTATYTYPSPGTYYVAFDVDNDECQIPAIREGGRNRALVAFSMGTSQQMLAPSSDRNGVQVVPIVIAAAPAPIPTMSQWGIIILFLVSTIGGVVFYLSSTGKYRGLHSKKYSN